MNRQTQLDTLGLALVSSCLAVLTTALVVIPQRIAQRPAQRGVLALNLDSTGQLRLWNRLVRAQEVAELLADAKEQPHQGQPVLRLIPDPAVPWGVVRQAAAALETSGVPLELQLP
jgi:biopolymer transport protein ExbD